MNGRWVVDAVYLPQLLACRQAAQCLRLKLVFPIEVAVDDRICPVALHKIASDLVLGDVIVDHGQLAIEISHEFQSRFFDNVVHRGEHDPHLIDAIVEFVTIIRLE